MDHLRQRVKRIFTCLLSVCLLATVPGGVLAHAAAKSTETPACYVAFGDSIAAGYGLSGYSDGQQDAPAGSYQALLADFLHTKSHNYAVTGDNSTDCIDLLNSGAADSDLKQADVITLSIGSNDLLLPFINIVMEYFQIGPDTIDKSMFTDGFQMPSIDRTELIRYYQQSQALIADLKDNATLHAQAAAFSGKLQEILSILRQKAPTAEIYVTNIYNPFHTVPMLGEMAQTYISEINQAFSADDTSYTLIDVYTPFSQEELTNVNMNLSDPEDLNIDPHPSAKGHQAIASCLTDALKQAHTPKAASLTSLSSSSTCKLAAKVKFGKDADGCQIQFASSKNGPYQALASTAKKTFRTNSGKLKAKKTYYIRVRSYKKIKGVTYYGKASKAKAVKIKAS